MDALISKVDSFLHSTHHEERRKAYLLMKPKLPEYSGCHHFLWQMARTTHLYVEALVRHTRHWKEHKELQFEARDYALAALEIEPNDADVQKWCALCVGGTTRFVGTRDKIDIGYQYKLYIDRAIELRPTDPRLRHLRVSGRFCFETASLTWIERKCAALFYAEPPSSTFEEALEEFFEAENLSPRTSVDNLLQIARCYIHKHDTENIRKYLLEATTVKATTPEDATAADEVKMLLRKYA